MTIWETLTACACSSGLTGLVLALLQRHWSRQDKQDSIVSALKVLTVDRVRYLAQCYIRDGDISLEDKETLQDMHRAYKALGGNGHLDTAMAAVEKLPIHNEGR